MAIIIDRRDTKSDKNTSNRERFIKRYRKYLKGSIEKVVDYTNIEDLAGSVDIASPPNWDLEEIDLGFSDENGEWDFVISGNKKYLKGDELDISKEDGDGKGSASGDGSDEFIFTLSKEEFFDLYFHDMYLPDFVKESMLDTKKMVYRRAGFTKDGIPSRLDILKTLQMAIARRVSAKGSESKVPFLDECDLRYRNFVHKPQPMLKAVMFCVMDVSGSMEQFHKSLAKKFFLFLYLFLTKNYESVELRFIRYHHSARDCSEKEFFYAKDTGGTYVSEALFLVNEIIDKEYPSSIYNIYVTHVSDGDSGGSTDEKNTLDYLDGLLAPKIQYYAYLQVMTERAFGRAVFTNDFGLEDVIKTSIHYSKKVNSRSAHNPQQIFGVLRDLFKKEK